jgi:predicted phage terminase large subunit-like protein
MSSENSKWKVLSFPAIAERDETYTIVNISGTRTFQRKAGDALHPGRESLALYARIRREIGEYNFQSQYQQNPSPPGGAMIDPAWFKWYEPGEQPATFSRIVISLDSANKSTELSNYSVFTIWGVYDRLYYLLDVVRLKLNFPELERKALELSSRFSGSTLLIEDRASGVQLIQTLQSQYVNGVTAYSPPAGADKVMRLHAQSSMFANGRVYLPKAASWLADYIQALTTFPGSRHSDQVDSTTQFLDYISQDKDLEVWARLGQIDLDPRWWLRSL